MIWAMNELQEDGFRCDQSSFERVWAKNEEGRGMTISSIKVLSLVVGVEKVRGGRWNCGMWQM